MISLNQGTFMEAAMRKRLFMYWNKPTNNFLGTDGSSSSIEIMENGDIVVIAAGIPLDTPGSTNLMRVAVVGKP